MPSPEPEQVEIVRQIVDTSSLAEVQTKIEGLGDATWTALVTDLPLWDEYRFDNETSFRVGEIEGTNNPSKTRIAYQNIYCLALGYTLFNSDGSRGTINPYLTPSRVVKNKVCL